MWQQHGEFNTDATEDFKQSHLMAYGDAEEPCRIMVRHSGLVLGGLGVVLALPLAPQFPCLKNGDDDILVPYQCLPYKALAGKGWVIETMDKKYLGTPGWPKQ